MDRVYSAVNPDPLTVNWLMSSIWTPVIALTTYFLVIYLMASTAARREPMNITFFLHYYNAFILLSNLSLLIYFVYYQVIGKFSPQCQPVGGRDENLNLRLAEGFYLYFLTKVAELTDSGIIVLRKKKSQANFVHFYHHASMLVIAWCGLRYLPGGSSIILASINTFFHMITYLYFHMATFNVGGAGMSSFRTVAAVSQIVQFSLAILHCIMAAVKNCGYPRFPLIFLIVYITSFVCLHYYCQGSLGVVWGDDKPSSVAEVTPSSLQQRKEYDAPSVPSTFLPQPATEDKMGVVTQVTSNRQVISSAASGANAMDKKPTTNILDKNNNGKKSSLTVQRNYDQDEIEEVSKILDEFGKFLMRIPQQFEDPMDRLIHNGVKQFSNKNKKTL